MKPCLSSLRTLHKLVRALAATDAPLHSQAVQKLQAEPDPSWLPASLSSTSMALVQLGLIDGREAGSDLSI